MAAVTRPLDLVLASFGLIPAPGQLMNSPFSLVLGIFGFCCIGTLIAESFYPLWYRVAVFYAFPAMVCPGISQAAKSSRASVMSPPACARTAAAWNRVCPCSSAVLAAPSTSLGVLFAMHWASAVLIPLMLGVMTSYALSPVVDRLQRWRVPRAAARR